MLSQTLLRVAMAPPVVLRELVQVSGQLAARFRIPAANCLARDFHG